MSDLLQGLSQLVPGSAGLSAPVSILVSSILA